MAYNPYYPYYPQYQAMQQPQQQQSALIHVQSEQQAREWSVSPGSSLMFIDDNAPYIYTKTAGNSQLEPCVFKVFQVSEIGGQNAPKTAAEEKSISIAGRKLYEENFSQVIYAENIIGLVKKIL